MQTVVGIEASKKEPWWQIHTYHFIDRPKSGRLPFIGPFALNSG